MCSIQPTFRVRELSSSISIIAKQQRFYLMAGDLILFVENAWMDILGLKRKINVEQYEKKSNSSLFLLLE